MDRKQTYFGDVEKCDICSKKLRTTMIDGASRFGWANMCKVCHARYGSGLGTGKGQLYKRQVDGSWLKVMG